MGKNRTILLIIIIVIIIIYSVIAYYIYILTILHYISHKIPLINPQTFHYIPIIPNKTIHVHMIDISYISHTSAQLKIRWANRTALGHGTSTEVCCDSNGAQSASTKPNLRGKQRHLTQDQHGWGTPGVPSNKKSDCSHITWDWAKIKLDFTNIKLDFSTNKWI